MRRPSEKEGGDIRGVTWAGMWAVLVEGVSALVRPPISWVELESKAGVLRFESFFGLAISPSM